MWLETQASKVLDTGGPSDIGKLVLGGCGWFVGFALEQCEVQQLSPHLSRALHPMLNISSHAAAFSTLKGSASKAYVLPLKLWWLVPIVLNEGMRENSLNKIPVSKHCPPPPVPRAYTCLLSIDTYTMHKHLIDNDSSCQSGIKSFC